MTSLVALGCVLPMTWPRGRDSFPLSTYPMFAEPRDDPSVVLVVAVLQRDGDVEVLPTEASGHRQLTQAVRALRSAVEAGGQRPIRLCAEVAEWVRNAGRADAGRVGLVTVAFDAVDFLVHGQRSPTVLEEHVWCPVAR